MVPVEVSVNCTTSGTVPLVGAAVNLAVGFLSLADAAVPVSNRTAAKNITNKFTFFSIISHYEAKYTVDNTPRTNGGGPQGRQVA